MVIAGGMAVVDIFSSHIIRKKKKRRMCYERKKRQSHCMFGMISGINLGRSILKF